MSLTVLPANPDSSAMSVMAHVSIVAERPPGAELTPIRSLVLNGLESDESKRAYGRAIDRFLAWWLQKEDRPALSRALLLEYRDQRKRQVSTSSVNLELSALRRLAVEAADNGLIPYEVAHQVNSVKSLKLRGVKLGNWMGLDKLRHFLETELRTLTDVRDRAILAVLAGCALRRTELAALRWSHLAIREERPVFLDIRGKGNKTRTVAIPRWVHESVVSWREAAGLTKDKEGPLFRCMNGNHRLTPDPITDQTVYRICHKRAQQLHVKIAPHDLRRTCAKLCREHGAELEDISVMLGHASLVTTQRYLGIKVKLKVAPNDFELKPSKVSP